MLAGRGFGKTRLAAEWLAWQAVKQDATRWAVIAPTYGDVRDTCVEGESGLLAILNRYRMLRQWNRSLGELTLKNGSRIKLFSADEPERLRGPQHHGAWCDELAAWRYPETWDQLQFGLRLGTDPRVVVTTTPKPTKLIRELTNRADVHVTRGSTFDNAANLAPSALTQLLARYEGTRLGRQELYGEILNDVEGALWSLDLIDSHRKEAPQLARVVIGVDPAVTSGEGSDETGIIAAGRDTEGHGYVLGDYSVKASPLEWAQRALDAYDTHKADAIVVEVNNGGDMIPTLIKQIRPGTPVKTVRASRGKHTRAEPIAAMYEQGRIHHTQPFTTLEDQLCSWTVDDPKSPDRLDALVWAFTELMTGTSVTGYLAQLAKWCERCNLPMPKQATMCANCGTSLTDEPHPLTR